jgi:hypothetical protein
LNYITIPVLLDYKLTDKLIFQIGTELGYLISANKQGTDVSNFWDQKLDFGITSGLKYLLFSKFNVQLRYTHGLSSVVNFDKFVFGDQFDQNGNIISSEHNAKFQNRAFQLSIGYILK